MKKRAMKKYIPYGDYCYGEITGFDSNKKSLSTTGMCKNMVYSHTINDAIVIPKELGSKEIMEVPCKRDIYKCRYTGETTETNALLWDDVKICGVKILDF